jgi:hypothetical protein
VILLFFTLVSSIFFTPHLGHQLIKRFLYKRGHNIILMIIRNIYFKCIAGISPPRLIGFVPEGVRKAAQDLCDSHTCWDCPLNSLLLWGWTDCKYLKGCLTGQCEICKENERTGTDTYKNPCSMCLP